MPTILHTREELMDLLAEPGDALIPELSRAVQHPDPYQDHLATTLLFEQGATRLADIQNIPQLTYTLYRNVQRFTDRMPYQEVRGEKRTKMALAALKVVLGDDNYLNLLHDYVWSTCEETNWMLPQVDHMGIELRVPATAMDLAEILVGLEDKIEPRAADRIRAEIETRVLTPYLRHPKGYHWYKGTNNWNGVCNGAIGCAFLLLERDEERLARALETVLEGLDAFLETAFEPNGASAEGVGYWMYGMSNFICFSEMLRSRTRGAIDLLATDRVKQIAQYPMDVMLSPGRYFPYSDCNEVTSMEPGLVTRLVERTGVEALRGSMASRVSMGLGRFHTAWRNMLWWDGMQPEAPVLEDRWLKDSEVVRLVSATGDGAPMVMAAKAGHNGVSHNHDDVGGFVLHVDGETLLCDPERGLYDLYKRLGHNQNLFANSMGHSVPKIGNTLQSRGAAFGGTVTQCETSGDQKHVEMEIGGAYEVAGLAHVYRTLTLTAGELVVADQLTFDEGSQRVEEGFVTWCESEVSGATARISGERHDVVLLIEEPATAEWRLEIFEEASTENRKEKALKRLSFEVERDTSVIETRVRMQVIKT